MQVFYMEDLTFSDHHMIRLGNFAPRSFTCRSMQIVF